MRIVIDMQGAQTESRFRGIGRYSLSLALAIVRNRKDHEVYLALSGLFPETIEPLRSAFDGLLSQHHIRIWYAPGPTREANPDNAIRRRTAEIIREAFIKSLCPDVVLVTSLFEGLGDDAVTSIGCFDTITPTAVILYDLIPLINPDEHYRKNPIHIDFYKRKIDSIKKSSMLLAISESSRNEALNALMFEPNQVVNISSGCDPMFHRIEISDEERRALFHKFGINKPFLMYTGGGDERKNLTRLIEAFGQLSIDLRKQYQLVIVGKIPDNLVAYFRKEAACAGLNEESVIFTGYVNDVELVRFYSLCQLFVFPSLHEGFGLPPLEAMACGAPVITSNMTSLPEIIGCDEAMFDPLSTSAISERIQEVLTNEIFRQNLIQHADKRIGKFSWDKSAQGAISALERIAKPCHFVETDTTIVRELDTAIFRPQYKHILVSKLDHMGDFILAIPAIMKLRARYPYACFDVLVGSWNVEAAKMLGVFQHIYTLDFFSKQSAIAPTAFEEKIYSLANSMQTYDLAIDLRRQSDTRFILVQMPAHEYAGYAIGDDSVDLRLSTSLPMTPDKPFVLTDLNFTPISEQMLRLVDALPSNPNDYIFFPDLLREHFIKNKKWVAIFPKAGNNVKEWGDENFNLLINFLLKDDEISKVTVYIQDQDDRRSFKTIDNPKFNIECGLSFSNLIVSVGCHGICIANNSFGGHLASYLGLYTIGVYAGQETAFEWGPVFGKATVFYTPVECSPCHISHRKDCPHNFQCLYYLTPNLVYATIRRFLAGKGAISPRKKVADDLISNLINKISFLPIEELTTTDQVFLSSCISKSIQYERRTRCFLDISELVLGDSAVVLSGIFGKILQQIFKQNLYQYEIVPIYATTNALGYRCAKKFINQFLKNDFFLGLIEDEFIDFQAGDIFLKLFLQNSQANILLSQYSELKIMRNHGVKIVFAICEQLCFTSTVSVNKVFSVFQSCLDILVKLVDIVICISREEANGLLNYVKEKLTFCERAFNIGWLDVDRISLLGKYLEIYSQKNQEKIAVAILEWLVFYDKGVFPPFQPLRYLNLKNNYIGQPKCVNSQKNVKHKQLLVDISELVRQDACSGIQRVVRSIIKEWFKNPPDGFQVLPVYATTDKLGYYYANKFISQFLQVPKVFLEDNLVEARSGDVFVGLDLNSIMMEMHSNYLKDFRDKGVKIWFVVYDLLPVLMPNNFSSNVCEWFSNWLKTVVQFDGVVCISHAVADEMHKWILANNGRQTLSLAIKWFHLGADISASVPSRGIPAQAEQSLSKIQLRPAFLMVGTLEPRKGYLQVLEAFEYLWCLGIDINLVIVGKRGWMVDLLTERLINHTRNDEYLFWMESISDEYLEKIYSASTCLIAASYGEGFGLPLIEAAQHNLPIIARDIPVFREVAGEHAYYFSGDTPEDLASTILNWQSLYKQGMHPKSDNMPWLTWAQSAEQLKEALGLLETSMPVSRPQSFWAKIWDKS